MTHNLTTTRAASLAPQVPTTSAALTAATAAPAAATDGVSVKGYSQLAVQVHSLDAVTGYQVLLWLYLEASEAWERVVDTTGANATLTGTTTGLCQVFNIAGFDRAYLQVTSLTGTSLKHSLRAVGPGL